ncbi:MAG: asparaginase [Bacteroidota bacterium]|nr:asparaginase [Bacteroidota bacterium]
MPPKFLELDKKQKQMKSNTQQSLLIIYTGGTIGMVENPEDKSLKPIDFSHILKEIPELKKISHKLQWMSLDPIVDSSDIKPENWELMAETIYKNYHKFDGFIILHGTDTMAYSASALSFHLENLAKPVIFTGSQLPMGLVRTDGRENLLSAIEIAAVQNNNGPMVPGVSIYFENKLFQGNRTTKYSAENFNAFVSPNYPILAESGVYLKFYKENIHYPKSGDKLSLHKKFNSHVGILKIFPGITKEFVEPILINKHLRAIVLETFGAGNATTEKWFIALIISYIKSGGVVLNVSQCLAGTVEQGKYETSRELKKAGVFGGSDITTEAAVTKLMCLLGQDISKKKLLIRLNNSISGEIN